MSRATGKSEKCNLYRINSSTFRLALDGGLGLTIILSKQKVLKKVRPKDKKKTREQVFRLTTTSSHPPQETKTKISF